MESIRGAAPTKKSPSTEAKWVPRDPRPTRQAQYALTRSSDLFPHAQTASEVFPSAAPKRRASAQLHHTPPRSKTIKRKPVPKMLQPSGQPMSPESSGTSSVESSPRQQQSKSTTATSNSRGPAPPRPVRLIPVNRTISSASCSSASVSSGSSSSEGTHYSHNRPAVFPTRIHQNSRSNLSQPISPASLAKIDLARDVNEQRRIEEEKRTREKEERELREAEEREKEQVEAIRQKRLQKKARAPLSARKSNNDDRPALPEKDAPVAQLASIWQRNLAQDSSPSPLLLQGPTEDLEEPLNISLSSLVSVPSGGLQIMLPAEQKQPQWKAEALIDDAASDIYFDAESTLTFEDESHSCSSSDTSTLTVDTPLLVAESPVVPMPTFGHFAGRKPSLATAVPLDKIDTQSIERISLKPATATAHVKQSSVSSRSSESSSESHEARTPPPLRRAYPLFDIPLPPGLAPVVSNAFPNQKKQAPRYF